MAREVARPSFINRTVLHEIPLEYVLDGVATLGEPIGMKGTRLQINYLFITCLTQHADSLNAVLEAQISKSQTIWLLHLQAHTSHSPRTRR